MTDDSLLPFDLPSGQRKKVSAAFDGGLISSDGGLVLLREAERSLRLAETLASCIRDRRNQAQIVHALSARVWRWAGVTSSTATSTQGRWSRSWTASSNPTGAASPGSPDADASGGPPACVSTPSIP